MHRRFCVTLGGRDERSWVRCWATNDPNSNATQNVSLGLQVPPPVGDFIHFSDPCGLRAPKPPIDLGVVECFTLPELYSTSTSVPVRPVRNATNYTSLSCAM